MHFTSLTSSRGTEVQVRSLLLLILALSLLPAGVSAGSFVIDTAGVTASVGEPVQIPVRVIGASDLSGYQIQLNTGNTPAAKISVSEASADGIIYSDDTGILIWAGALRGETISGDAELFCLEVIPKTKSSITLTLSVSQTFSGTAPAVQVQNYQGYETVLSIGKNTGEGKPLDEEEEVFAPPAESGGSYDYSMPDMPKPADTDAAFPIPYWILIILAVTALVLLITLRKNV